MVRSCAAFNCSYKHRNKDKNGRNVTFHRFPMRNESLNRKWIAAIRRENFVPTVHHVLCSIHFEDSCYLSNYVNRRQLKDNAVPTIFDFPSHLNEVPVKEERKAQKPRNKVGLARNSAGECLNEMSGPSTSKDQGYSLASNPSGLHYTIESNEIIQEVSLHMNRQSKFGSKDKKEQIIKSEPLDESDIILPSREINLSSIGENYIQIQKVEKVSNKQTDESLVDCVVESSAEIEIKEELNGSFCTVLIKEEVMIEEEEEEVIKEVEKDVFYGIYDELSHVEKVDFYGIYDEHNYVEKVDLYGIYDEHNYVAISANKISTKQYLDNRKYGQIVSENRSIGCDFRNPLETTEQEPDLNHKLPTSDLGNFMVDEALRRKDVVYAVENKRRLTCINQEVDINTSQSLHYKTIRSVDLPVIQDNRKLEPQDYSEEVKQEMSCESTIERDEYIQKKKPRGKAKFIGQSKAEKEMALQLIETFKHRGNNESLKCHICNPPRSFTARGTLFSHYRSHAGIKPYDCQLCKASFTRQQSLKYHMLIHTNQTCFTCADCGRKFRHSSHFKIHKRRHTGEAPYECSDCMNRFKTRNTYKRHLKTRHGKVLTASGGLIILSDEEFCKVHTHPRYMPLTI